jgi:hypothetical protein
MHSVHSFQLENRVERRCEMNPQQKAAWFVLIVIGVTAALYGAAVPALSWWFHCTMAETAGPALGLFGLLGLAGLSILFYHPLPGRKPRNRVLMDERDSQLYGRAWYAGMACFWLFFVFGGMGVWAYWYFLRGLQWVTVPIAIFPCMIGAGAIVFLLVQSLATLHFYGWKASDADQS